MGGGNGLKSHMARERKQAKVAATGKGGGGKEGIKERTESKQGTVCAICKTPFTSTKMRAQLKEHWEVRHPRNTWSDCFPGEEAPTA
jgi:hypothetical protein